jgi:hypothetical protein
MIFPFGLPFFRTSRPPCRFETDPANASRKESRRLPKERPADVPDRGVGARGRRAPRASVTLKNPMISVEFPPNAPRADSRGGTQNLEQHPSVGKGRDRAAVPHAGAARGLPQTAFPAR